MLGYAGALFSLAELRHIMTDYVFPPQEQASVAVRGSAQRYAVHRIFCVGRNYAAHAREIYLQAGRSHAMPPGNVSEVTPDERRLLVAWYESAVNGRSQP